MQLAVQFLSSLLRRCSAGSPVARRDKSVHHDVAGVQSRRACQDIRRGAGDNRSVDRLLFLARVMAVWSGHLAAGERRLTLSETQQLAQAALGEQTKSLAFHLEPPPLPPKRGAMFEVLLENPASGRLPPRRSSSIRTLAQYGTRRGV